MVTTSTAEKNNYRCPQCGDSLSEDKAGKGFVRHTTNPDCDFERGQRDPMTGALHPGGQKFR
jgi:hypothetical protein